MRLPPLNKLIRPEAARVLLDAFVSSTPGSGLALLRADGTLLASAGVSPAMNGDVSPAAHAGDWPAGSARTSLYPLRSGAQVLGNLAVTGQVAGVDGLLRSLELLIDQGLELRELGRETLERYREINLLYHIGETIGACLDSSEIPCLLLDDAHEVLRAEMGVVLLSSPSGRPELNLQECLGTPSQVQALMDSSSALVEQVVQSGEPDLWSESDPTNASTRLSAGAWPVGTILCSPLKTHDRSLGVVVLGRPAGAPPFTAGDQKLAMALASQAGIAIERARLHLQELERQRMEEELALGRRIQLSLLPGACPALPGWDFAAHYQAARQVGGDFYDFIPLHGSTGSLGVVIADVTGKGVPAALMVAATRSLLRAESRRDPHLTPSPREVLEQASQVLYVDNPARLFLTAFYAVLEPNSGRVVYANGGHEYPFWLHSATGECQPLLARSTLVGAFPSIELEERQVELATGDLLVFYTDGVTEARDGRGEMYGEDRLRSVIAGCARAQANQALETIVQAVSAFVGEAPQADDFTIVVARRVG